MSTDPFIGSLMQTAFSFPPRGWALCDGQILAIAQNQALFSLLGTQYGGNGQTTFALPDLRGRLAIGAGAGPGLASYTVGQLGGVETVTLGVEHLPVHAHALTASGRQATTGDPTDALLAAGDTLRFSGAPSPVTMGLTAAEGGNQPHTNLAPSLTLSWAIALQGIFPSRN